MEFLGDAVSHATSVTREVELSAELANDNGDRPIVSAIAPWFGGNRMLAREVGRALSGCSWVGVPFMGGGAELFEIDARAIVANDRHRLLMNLALVIADRSLGPMLYRRLRRLPFHSDTLEMAQHICDSHKDRDPRRLTRDESLALAEAYFVACWAGRSANAGTVQEFCGGLPVRWNAAGGDSAKRLASAVESIPAFRRWFRRCSFLCVDAFDFLDKCKDEPGIGVYVDAPWPGAGDKYRHKFTRDDQERLAQKLAGFKCSRVVVRFGDHPLIRELYSSSLWEWRELVGRKQSNRESCEVLLINKSSRGPF